MLTHEGKEYARVSDIIRPFADFSHIDPVVLANKARIGTEVHQAITDDINGEFPCMSPECRGYFESYMKWRDHLGIKFVASEERYFDKEKMITGQIDALVRMPGLTGYPILVDFKTSAQESKETWPMQAHLYGYLLNKNRIYVASRYIFVKLSKNGTIPMVFEYVLDSNIYIKCMNAIDDFWSKHTK